ncbi:MAG: hypothetical protein HOC18_04040 [Candidatus Marinimicrobia bacterium]|jgi:hypothetical protein|nr:hypothetical protein [Candidatus Neomarinimicrobiota bacterium]
MNPVKKMIGSILNKNVSEFQTEFDSAVKDRIAVKVDDMKGGISNTLISPVHSTPEEEPQASNESVLKLVNSLRFVTENNDAVVLELLNGEEVDLIPEDANKINNVHDMLTTENQEVFRNKLMQDAESFKSMVSFACEKAG